MQRLRDIERELRVAETATQATTMPGSWSARRPTRIDAPVPVAAAADGDGPGRVEGRDRSGTIRVTVGPDGLPESVSVEPGWLRTVGPERFASALGEAAGAAVEESNLAALTAFGEQDAAELAELSRELE